MAGGRKVAVAQPWRTREEMERDLGSLKQEAMPLWNEWNHSEAQVALVVLLLLHKCTTVKGIQWSLADAKGTI
jgi:hypothetical protein